MVKPYIPDRKDIMWLMFTPQAGYEQTGRRPALVLSPKKYNEKTNLAVVCPITSTIKGYPFEVIVESKKIHGAILSDQIKSLDWKERKAEYIVKIDDEAFEEVVNKLRVLIVE